MKCEHPDCVGNCADKTIGCDAECYCCMGEMAVYNFLTDLQRDIDEKNRPRLENALEGMFKVIENLSNLREQTAVLDLI